MALKERLSPTAYLDEEGDVLPFADIQDDFDRIPAANASIVQGMTNLRSVQSERRDMELAEADGRRLREHKVAQAALETAGAYIPLEQLDENRLALLDAVSDMSMYRGGEKGGYQTSDFDKRYTPRTSRVEAGARRNHQKLVNKTIPELLKASQLVEAGFSQEDVDDKINVTRMLLMREYGGPENEPARRKFRTQLKRKQS